MTARIDPRNPSALSTVWAAQPAWAPYVPLFAAAPGVPGQLVTGEHFRAGYELLKLHTGDKTRGVLLPDSFLQRRGAIQGELYADAEKAEEMVRTAHERGETDEAEKIATDCVVSGCAKLMHFLKEVQ